MNKKRKSCPYCRLEFLEKNLRSHIFKRHAALSQNLHRDSLGTTSQDKIYTIDENGVVKFIKIDTHVNTKKQSPAKQKSRENHFVICPECQSTVRASGLDAHLARAHGKGPDKQPVAKTPKVRVYVACPKCDAKFKSDHKLENHLIKVHKKTIHNTKNNW